MSSGDALEFQMKQGRISCIEEDAAGEPLRRRRKSRWASGRLSYRLPHLPQRGKIPFIDKAPRAEGEKKNWR
jgi:hypothetical protein